MSFYHFPLHLKSMLCVYGIINLYFFSESDIYRCQILSSVVDQLTERVKRFKVMITHVNSVIIFSFYFFISVQKRKIEG